MDGYTMHSREKEDHPISKPKIHLSILAYYGCVYINKQVYIWV